MSWSRIPEYLEPCQTGCGAPAGFRHQVELEEREIEGVRVIRTKSIYRCGACAPRATSVKTS